MTCYWCIVEFESDDEDHRTMDQIRPAVTVYNGMACCETHLNIVRGHPDESGYATTFTQRVSR